MESEYSKIPGWQSTSGSISDALKNGLPFLASSTVADTVLGFRVGDWGFILPNTLHCEVIEALPVNPLPKVDPWFSGLLSIRGNIAPVVDLRLLSETTTPPKKRYLLAMDRGEKTMVLWTDDYPKMMADLKDPLAEIPPLPEQLSPCVRTAYALQGQLWMKVQFEPLFKSLGLRQRSQGTGR
jgi:chemotaxis signal transduction protein